MITLEQLYNNFKNFNAVKAADEIIMSNGEIAVSLNRQQMIDGENSKDNEITPSYFSSDYAAFKNRKNSRAGLGTPDLRNTGRFQDLMKFVKKGNKYFVTSIDQKTGMLTVKYGADIFGLQPINSQSFRNKNDKDFIEKKLKPLFK